MFQCSHCDKEFGTERGLDTHVGIKHKAVNVRLSATDESLLDDLVSANKEKSDDEMEGGWAYFDGHRAITGIRSVRALVSGYGVQDESLGRAMAVETGFHMETIRATAEAERNLQLKTHNRSIDSRILAAQRLAEDTLMEGDVFAAVVSPIELGMGGRVWVTGGDSGAVKEINGLLSAWGVMNTITAAWQDMETYSAFYVLNRWQDGTPTPIHFSPKKMCVGPDTGFGPIGFRFLGLTGDELQAEIDIERASTGSGWNEWLESIVNKPLPPGDLSWVHFLKPRHKMYPYPWVAKAATPAYTRQIIEEMRLALVQGLINQLWLMTIEDPLPGEVKKLKSVIAANRAERIGFLLWRSGLKVENFAPESIEQLLLPDSWWMATLDIFRRMGRTIRIISGEPAQRSGQGSGDAEVDVQIAQNKAMAHRAIVANKIVLDLIRQWSSNTKNSAVKKLLASGSLTVNTTPIQLFLGEQIKEIWGPMWDRGMASVQTIHAALGLDTDAETEQLKAEQAAGYDEVYQARQQFAQRVATPSGEVTRSPEPGRPEGQQVTASIEDTQNTLLESFGSIDEAENQEERKRRVEAFIMLLAVLIKAQIREAFTEGYSTTLGRGTPNNAMMNVAMAWEQEHIDGFSNDLLAAVDMDAKVIPSFRYRVIQHVQATWRRGYMDGVFQAKAEDGWKYWQRVLRPDASRSGPCEICREDSKVWHPISEPFWDHPYGVCSSQIVKFMRTGTDGWESFDRQMVAVPLMDWEE
jgi:hypothetical protein